MKILLAVDGSESSQAAIAALSDRPWPGATKVKVLAVVHTRFPVVGDPFFETAAAHFQVLGQEQRRLNAVVRRLAEQLRGSQPSFDVETTVIEGVPKRVIVEQAESWGADLILMGSHGYGPLTRFALGSVSQSVVQHAPCSVEVVRARAKEGAQGEA